MESMYIAVLPNYSKREIKRRKKLDKHYKSNGKPFSQSQDYFNFIYKD